MQVPVTPSTVFQLLQSADHEGLGYEFVVMNNTVGMKLVWQGDFDTHGLTIALNLDGTWTAEIDLPVDHSGERKQGKPKISPALAWDNMKALAEGWDLWDVDGRLQLQRIDSPGDHDIDLGYDDPKFASDTDAIIYVAAQAAAGSAYHREALSLIGHLAE